MNLYLVNRADDHGYDETDSRVVAAPDELEARKWGADLSGDQPGSIWHARTTTVALIGATVPDAEPGVVLSSFNAG